MPSHDTAGHRAAPARASGLAAFLACLPQWLSAGDLPPPPSAAGASTEATSLYLGVEVNGRPGEGLVAVRQRGSHFEIDAAMLRRLHVQTDQPDGTPVAVDTLPGVSVAYDSLAQRLRIDVPAQWLPMQRLGGGGGGGGGSAAGAPGNPAAEIGWLPMQRLAGESPEDVALSRGTGLLMNYEFYATRTQGRTAASLWSEQRFFGLHGVVSHTGVLRRVDGGSGNGYLRYDTAWTDIDAGSATAWTAGDLITGALPWTTPVRLGGVQWARNFAARPDLVTYPIPEFAGQATVPSAVDVFVNGFRASRHTVQPGPFTLGELPAVNGAGMASVVTTDALGRQVVTSVPFYVSSQLLRPGWTDYSVSVGALRRGYGLRSFAYGRPLAAGVLRRGVTDAVTVEAQAQAARGLGVLGAGGLVRWGTLGVFNASLTYGRAVPGDTALPARSGGWQWSAGYQYNTPRGGISLLETRRLHGFGDAADYGGSLQPSRLSRQVNASLVVGSASLGAGWVDLRGAGTERSRLAYAWRIAQTRGGGPAGSMGGNYRLASAQYQGRHGMVQGGLFGAAADTTHWAGASGSLGAMDGYVFAANRVTDGFALVSTDGAPGVPITVNHQPAGRTDGRGYLLVPNVPAYYPARYAIDPLSLPPDVHTPALERQVAVARGTGTLVRMPVLRMRTATLTLVDSDGVPLPPGSAVVHEQGQVPTVVGWDGVVYLTALHTRNTLAVRTPDGRECRAAFDAAEHAAQRDLRVVCHEGGAPPSAASAAEDAL
ncbi:fimbria/pilus outer membrane usher protein [Paracidovorax oryzae]|uniref:fimbria/pilus outer membrane usher protein n=1 Tax=Paracidovorax oryzae TaxID=862720 RepID=UPI0002D77D50|nr:fimbria/pilus outer membrane usher protein [Paracidovorax oryzae]